MNSLENNCSLDTNTAIIQNNENILFDSTLINPSSIYYNNGIFRINKEGLYLINLNIYIENTSLPYIIFNINYTTDNKPYKLAIALKGIDDIGTQTAHSLTLPCSFSNNFYENDILYVTNVSGGTVNLVSNYVPNTLNAIISINKVN